MKKLEYFIKLSRYDEFYGAILFLTALGLFTIRPVELQIKISILAANMFGAAFVFLFNNIEDASEDLKDPEKRSSNPVSLNNLSRSEAKIGALVILIISLFFYHRLGIKVLTFGSIALLLGFLYSWKKVRLKNLPIIDIISHSFEHFLAYFIPILIFPSHANIIEIIIVGGAVFLSSALGDIKNEIRDYDLDRKIGLTNTAHFIDLKPFRKYIFHSEITVLMVIIIYLLIELTLIGKILFLSVVLLTSIHYYKTWLSKTNLILDYPQRHLSFTVLSLILFFS